MHVRTFNIQFEEDWCTVDDHYLLLQICTRHIIVQRPEKPIHQCNKNPVVK